MHHRSRNWVQHSASFEQFFIFSGSCFLAHCITSEFFRTADPVSFKIKARMIAMATPYKRGVNAVWKCSSSICAAPPEARCKIPAKTGPNKALKVKLRKLTTPVAVPPSCGGIASLVTLVGHHRRPRGNPRNETKHIGRKDVRVSVEYPRQTSKQHNCAADDHRLAPANPV